MQIPELILKLILMIAPWIFNSVKDRDEAIKRFREIITDFEQADESSDLLGDAESQIRELESMVSDNKKS